MPITERERAYLKEYRKLNKERLREKTLAWRAANPERVKSYDKKSKTKNWDAVKERQYSWRERNIDRVREVNRKSKIKTRFGDFWEVKLLELKLSKEIRNEREKINSKRVKRNPMEQLAEA